MGKPAYKELEKKIEDFEKKLKENENELPRSRFARIPDPIGE